MQGNNFLDWLGYLSFEIKVGFEQSKSIYYGQVISERQKLFLLSLMDQWAFTDEEIEGIEAQIQGAKEGDFEGLKRYLEDPTKPVDMFPDIPPNDDLTKSCVVWEQEIITLLQRAKDRPYGYKTDHEDYKYFKLIGWRHPKFYSAEQRLRFEFDAYLMRTTKDLSNPCRVLIPAA